jgi:hypothetical protein
VSVLPLAPDGADPKPSFPAEGERESEFVWHEIDGVVNIARAAICIGKYYCKSVLSNVLLPFFSCCQICPV